MATIKSYTDIEQSKKLYELGFGIDSADMYYLIKRSDCRIPWEEAAKDDANVILFPKEIMSGNLSDYRLPCWSLAALLDVLPNNENISTNLSKGGYRISTLEYTNSWFVDYEDETNGLNNCVTSADNPVDACYEMIIHLNELNLL